MIPWIICLMLIWSVGILATMCKSLYKTEICFSITHIMKSVENNVFFCQFSFLTIYNILGTELKITS
ncbi:unnamed protein product [Gulo gulo]|uniref:Secreted protein n=1 Tax=Gulo gulo TaxID=48420 RepID=A0A9X9MAU1_GULGU|nr:unnamed protein product [Gulo gulo]